MPSRPKPKPRDSAGSSSAAIVHTIADSATTNSCCRNCSPPNTGALGASAVRPLNTV
jgi:hypothetical protein